MVHEDRLLVRTYTDRHGLKDLARDLVGVEISKQQQSSDWGAEALSEAQIAYAASDVLYLHQIRDKLTGLLEREGRTEIAEACFRFLPTKARLDLIGWAEADIRSRLDPLAAIPRLLGVGVAGCAWPRFRYVANRRATPETVTHGGTVMTTRFDAV